MTNPGLLFFRNNESIVIADFTCIHAAPFEFAQDVETIRVDGIVLVEIPIESGIQRVL